jgi:hypothetical protein
MGSGGWDTNSYNVTRSSFTASGIDPFAYSSATKASTPRTSWKADDTLSPLNIGFRESRDSDEHPNAVPIIILFDVTGSMGSIPVTVQDKLGQVFGLLLRKGYVDDPQILVGAIGDSDTDYVPFQVSQFESDNRIDDNLRKIFLEGNGGGDQCEGYEMAPYFAARHTVTDHWEKRGKKGYMFIIGDEMNKSQLSAKNVKKIFGDDLEGNISIKDIYKEAQEKWNIFSIFPSEASYFRYEKFPQHWKDLLGERALVLDDQNAVGELIAATIGVFEDSVDVDEVADDIKSIGSNAGQAVTKSLSVFKSKNSAGVAVPSNLSGADDLA